MADVFHTLATLSIGAAAIRLLFAARRVPWCCAYLTVCTIHYAGWNPWTQVRFDPINVTLALLKFCAAVEAFSIIAEREWPRERASRMMLLLAITAFVSAITVGVFHVNMSSYDLYRAARLFSVTATATFCAFGLLLYAIQPLNPRAGAVRHAVTLTVLMVAMAAVNWLDLVLPRSMATWQALNHSFFATATLCGMAWVLYGTPRPAASAFR